MIVVAAGSGVALVVLVAKWALSTCEDCRVIITANTGNQLASKTFRFPQQEVSR